MKTSYSAAGNLINVDEIAQELAKHGSPDVIAAFFNSFSEELLKGDRERVLQELPDHLKGPAICFMAKMTGLAMERSFFRRVMG